VVTRTIRLQGFDGRSLDAEGLAVTPQGTLLVASEKEPSIREFSRDGRLLGSLPVPEAFLAGSGRGVAQNLGFESLSLSPDGNVLWTGTERALRQDAPGADKLAASPARLLRYRRTPAGFVPDGEFIYPVDAIQVGGGGGFAVRGLSELLALPGGGLLALEREFVQGRGNRVQIYAISTAGAQDVSTFDSLSGRAVQPVRKTLLFDFAGAGFHLENLEGMTLGPRLPDGDATLVLVSDDNFMPLFQRTQIVALRLRCPAGAV